MQLISADSMSLSRVYFTEFDRVTYSQVAWNPEDVESIRHNMERKLKLIALTKGHVVIAASHLLESELAQEVLFPHPKLFSRGIIVPALRSEFNSFESFLNSKLAEEKESDHYKGNARRDMAQMLDSQVAVAVQWKAYQTSNWFKNRLLSDMRDEQSLLRSCLREGGTIIPSSLITQIDACPKLSRQYVYVSAKKIGDKKLWNMLCEYTDFIYYLSGARAVCSEGILPQENLMDFSLSDLLGGRTQLSDAEVFFKMFVDIVKAATHTHFPLDMLDALSIDDILNLHTLAIEDRFVEKYNAIQEKTKDGLAIHDSERLILLMEELEEFEQQLHYEYLDAIEKELPKYLRDRKKSKAGKFLNATASLFISPWGLATGTRDMVISGLELAGIGRIADTTQERIRQRLKACSNIIGNANIEDKPILLSFVRKLQKRYTEKMLEE